MGRQTWDLDEDGLPIFNMVREERRKVSAHQRRVIWELREGKCYYCNIFVPRNEMTIDHKIPLSRAAEHDLVDPYIGKNLALCCHKCNVAKGNMTAKEFFEKMKEKKSASK